MNHYWHEILYTSLKLTIPEPGCTCHFVICFIVHQQDQYYYLILLYAGDITLENSLSDVTFWWAKPRKSILHTKEAQLILIIVSDTTQVYYFAYCLYSYSLSYYYALSLNCKQEDIIQYIEVALLCLHVFHQKDILTCMYYIL